MLKDHNYGKKGLQFFVFICLLVFGVSACGRENVSDPSEGKKASAENPKTTDRSSEESEQTSEQTEASVSAEETFKDKLTYKTGKKRYFDRDRSRASKPGYRYERARAENAPGSR